MFINILFILLTKYIYIKLFVNKVILIITNNIKIIFT